MFAMTSNVVSWNVKNQATNQDYEEVVGFAAAAAV